MGHSLLMNKFIEEDKIADQKDSWCKELERRKNVKGQSFELGLLQQLPPRCSWGSYSRRVQHLTLPVLTPLWALLSSPFTPPPSSWGSRAPTLGKRFRSEFILHSRHLISCGFKRETREFSKDICLKLISHLDKSFFIMSYFNRWINMSVSA